MLVEYLSKNVFGNVFGVSRSLPPRKTIFSERREREFLYLDEIDAVIAAVAQTRASCRNTALALLLFCQGLQPAELSNFSWDDVDFAENIFKVRRTRTSPNRYSRVYKPKEQPLCAVETEILQQLHSNSVSNWMFVSERQTQLSERSLRHIIQLSGTVAGIPFPIHPYMLRNSGLFYRSALLLQATGLSLRQCCLLWNWHGTKIEFSPQQQQEYSEIRQDQEEAFLAAIKQLRAFTGIGFYQNVIDYLLGAYLLFPKLEDIPDNYWLAPIGWI